MNLHYMSEVLKNYRCYCIDSMVVDLSSSSCALQKLD